MIYEIQIAPKEGRVGHASLCLIRTRVAITDQYRDAHSFL